MKKLFALTICVIIGLSAMAQDQTDNYSARRMGLYFGFIWNGSLNENPKQDSNFGSFSLAEIGFDGCLYRHENGVGHYFMLNFGGDRIIGKRMKKGHDSFGTYGYVKDDEGEFLFKDYITYYNGSIGYMLGVKLGHVGELQPFVRFGYETYTTPADVKAAHIRKMAKMEGYTINDEITDDNATHNHAYILEPGMRMAFNVFYPLQMYVQVVYSTVLSASDTYKIVNKYTKNFGYGHEKGLGLGAGFRLCF